MSHGDKESQGIAALGRPGWEGDKSGQTSGRRGDSREAWASWRQVWGGDKGCLRMDDTWLPGSEQCQRC